METDVDHDASKLTPPEDDATIDKNWKRGNESKVPAAQAALKI